MIDTIWALFLYAGLVSAAWIATVIVIHSWAPAATRRSSSWAVEAFVILIGPVHLTTEFLSQYGGFFLRLQTGTRALEIVLVILVAIEAVRRPRRSVHGLLLLLVLYFVALVLSAFLGATSYVPETYVWFAVGLVAVIANGAISTQAMLALARASLRAIVVISGVALILVPDDVFYSLQGRTLFGLAQFEGITTHPNTMGFIAVLGLIIEIGTHGRWKYAILFAATVVAAQSSTAYMIAIVGVAVLLAHRVGASTRVVAIIGALLVPSVFLDFDALTSWLPSDISTFTGRTGIWQAALSQFHRFPVFGYGPSLLNEQFRYDAFGSTFDAAGQAHNQFVQDLGGAGIVGLAALVALMIVVVIRAVRWSDSSDGLTPALCLALLGRMMVETPLRPTGLGPDLFILVMTIGVIVAWERQPDTLHSAERTPVAGCPYSETRLNEIPNSARSIGVK